MNNSTYRFTLDLRKHNSQMAIAVFQYDTAVTLNISFTDGGKRYQIADGCTASLYGIRPDGAAIVHPCNINGNTEVEYDFESSISCVAGTVKCQLRIFGTDGKLITAPIFTIVVDERLVDDEDIEIDGESPTSALDRIMAMTSEVEGKLEEVDNKLAEIQDGDNAHFRYSAHSDGTDFTEAWSPGQDYIGIASQAEAPTTKDGYTWVLFRGEKGEQGNQGIQGIQGVPGEKGEQGSSIASINSGEAVVEGGYTNTPVTVKTTDGQTVTLYIRAKNGVSGGTSENNIFIGTMSEYQEAYDTGLIAKGTIVIIDEDETTAVLGKAILGKMILGKGA